ncbi:hypothetical protein D3C79_713200 [compost metagenome]
MHEGIARQTQGGHAAIDLSEERTQAIVGADAERRMALFTTTVLAQRWQERLVGIAVGGEDKELKLGRHHRRQATGGVTSDYRLEQAATGQSRAFAVELDRIANRQGPRLITPGQAIDVLRVGHQRQVAIVAAIEARRRVTAHDALQQDAAGHLQAAAFEKAFSGHHLAPRHSIEVRGNALDLINARQSLGE